MHAVCIPALAAAQWPMNTLDLMPEWLKKCVCRRVMGLLRRRRYAYACLCMYAHTHMYVAAIMCMRECEYTHRYTRCMCIHV